jgi:hypothetical protein
MTQYLNILDKAELFYKLAQQLDPREKDERRKLLLEDVISKLNADLRYSNKELSDLNSKLENIKNPSSILTNRRDTIKDTIVRLQSDISEAQRELNKLNEQLKPPPKKFLIPEIIIDLAKVYTKKNKTDLVPIPYIVSKLPNYSIGEIHQALKSGYLQGKIELRPESGFQTLSKKDALVCMPGPRGSILSTMRVIEQPK